MTVSHTATSVNISSTGVDREPGGPSRIATFFYGLVLIVFILVVLYAAGTWYLWLTDQLQFGVAS